MPAPGVNKDLQSGTLPLCGGTQRLSSIISIFRVLAGSAIDIYGVSSLTLKNGWRTTMAKDRLSDYELQHF